MPDKKGAFFSYFLILFLGFNYLVHSQIKNNLDIFYTLADSSVNRIVNNIDLSSIRIKVDLNNGDAYYVFDNHILEFLISKKIKLVSDLKDSTSHLLYSIENADTKYSDLFRKGFLGSYQTIRQLTFKGNYFLTNHNNENNTHTAQFIYKYIDTINVDDVKSLENNSFKFTTGTLPPEPFIAGLFEPVFALGTAAVAVILFFTVRSK